MSGLFGLIYISIEYWMDAVSQSLPMSVKSTFEGVGRRCFNNMVWQCISGVHYPVAEEQLSDWFSHSIFLQFVFIWL